MRLFRHREKISEKHLTTCQNYGIVGITSKGVIFLRPFRRVRVPLFSREAM